MQNYHYIESHEVPHPKPVLETQLLIVAIPDDGIIRSYFIISFQYYVILSITINPKTLKTKLLFIVTLTPS